MSNITTAVNLVHKLDNQYTYDKHMFVLNSKYSDIGLLTDNECPGCKCAADIGLGHCQNCGTEWCVAHASVLSEGGYCAACEATADIQQAIGMRMKYYVNNYFTNYYIGRPAGRTRRVPPNKVREYIAYCWTLSYEQCLLDLMQDGYSMCVVSPMIKEIHARIDAGYAEYLAQFNDDHINMLDELSTF